MTKSNSNSATNLASLNFSEITNEAKEFELEHEATRQGLGIFLSVIGTNSKTFKDHVRRENNAANKRAFERQRKGRDTEPETAESREDLDIRLCVTLIKGWRTEVDGVSKPVVYWGDSELECTPDNVEKVLRSFDWMRPQVVKFAEDMGNFIGS